MSVVKVSCTDQVLKFVQAPVIASGGVNEVKLEFDFCEKWDGFVKTALFYQDESEIYYALLDENDTCVVPWEVCYSDGAFYFTVLGEKDDIRRTATTLRYKVRKGVISESMMPSNPTPEVYDQIISMIAGVKPMIVTLDIKTNTASHSSAEIKEHLDKGEEVLLLYGGFVLRPISAVATRVVFSVMRLEYDRVSTTKITILGDKSIQFEQSGVDGSDDRIREVIDAYRQEKPMTLTVKIVDDEFASHDWDEIHDYWKNGWNVLLAVDNRFVMLNRISVGTASFVDAHYIAVDGEEVLQIDEYTIVTGKYWDKTSLVCNLNSAANDDNMLIVRLTSDTDTSHTVTEIEEAVDKGRIVYLYTGQHLIALDGINSAEALFVDAHFNDEGVLEVDEYIIRGTYFGRLFKTSKTYPSGGSDSSQNGDELELIVNLEISESVQTISINEDMDGNELKLKEMVLFMEFYSPSDTATSNVNGYINKPDGVGAANGNVLFFTAANGTNGRLVWVHIDAKTGKMLRNMGGWTNNQGIDSNVTTTSIPNVKNNILSGEELITSLFFKAPTAFEPGTKIQIYGVKA